MGWSEKLFGAVEQAFGFFKQEYNPENRRLKKIENIESNLIKKRKLRDSLTAKQLGEEDDEEKKNTYAIELYNVTLDIIKLRSELEKLKR